MGRFLILSDAGDGVGLAARLKAEGHEAKIHILDPMFENQGKGIVDCVCEYSMGQTIIADVTGFGHILESYRDSGARIFGGGVFADKLEKDRSFAEEVMNRARITTPSCETAKTWEDAVRLIRSFGDKYGKMVIKPEGSLSGVVPSSVVSDVEEGLAVLEQMRREHGDSGVELTIQEFVKGIAVSTEGWFTGEEWVEGMFNHTIERKQFLNDDLGPSGGCTGNLVWPCGSDDPLVRELLLKLTVVLREHRYVGPIDVNAIVNEDGVYGLEFTPRFGYDAFPTALHSLCDFDFGVFIDSLARNEVSDVRLTDAFGAGVRLSLPPWPSEQFKAEQGVPIRGFDEDARQYFYPYGVMLVDDEVVSSGGVGILGVMNYEGSSIGQAFACVYHQISKLKAQGLQYRTDMSEACLKDYRELRSLLTGDDGGWIGVDLDGTLAEYSGWSNDIGEPIPKMVQRVKRWIADGKEVRIFSARGSVDGEGEADKYVQLMKIYDWVEKHIRTPLEVTSKKDPLMIRLYDDRVRQVEEGTGELVGA